MKKDIYILLTIIIVSFICFLIIESPINADFKNNQKKFWANIKGETLVNSSFATNILNTTITSTTTKIEEIPQEEIKEKVKLTPPLKFVIIGDSMILVGFGPALEQTLLSYPEISVYREGQYSTGLNRIDYFDWYARTQLLIDEQKPDVLIVMYGANDGQSITDSNGYIAPYFSPDWFTIYHQRVNAYLATFSPQVKQIIWVGPPSTENIEFKEKLWAMHEVYSSECIKFENVKYVYSWEKFNINGQSASVMSDSSGVSQLVKQDDGVHLTDHGGKILAEFVIESMSNEVVLVQEEVIIEQL